MTLENVCGFLNKFKEENCPSGYGSLVGALQKITEYDGSKWEGHIEIKHGGLIYDPLRYKLYDPNKIFYNLLRVEEKIMEINGREISQFCHIETTTEDAAREIWSGICTEINNYRETLGDSYDITTPPGECDLDGREINYRAFKDYTLHIDLFIIIRKWQSVIDNVSMMGW